MKIFGLPGAFFKTRIGRSPLRHSYESLTEFFSADNREEKRRRAFLCLVHSLLSRNGVVSGERIETVRRLIETRLEEREKRIIIRRYGLDNRPCATQREIAKRMGISRSYVSRLEKCALEKIRDALTHK